MHLYDVGFNFWPCFCCFLIRWWSTCRMGLEGGGSVEYGKDQFKRENLKSFVNWWEAAVLWRRVQIFGARKRGDFAVLMGCKENALRLVLWRKLRGWSLICGGRQWKVAPVLWRKAMVETVVLWKKASLNWKLLRATRNFLPTVLSCGGSYGGKLWFVEEGKRGELWVVEEGKEGKFHLCGERQGGRGGVLVVGALLRARLCCSFIGWCLRCIFWIISG